MLVNYACTRMESKKKEETKRNKKECEIIAIYSKNMHKRERERGKERRGEVNSNEDML